MESLKTLISIWVVLFLCPISFSNAEEDFPKIGFVRNDNVNVRAGDNINFESLCQLKKGDPIKIIGRRYSWFKIKLPRDAYAYIKTDYVDLSQEKNRGIVKASRVNIRVGPGTKYSIMGQVSAPEELNVLGEEDGWYKIEPPNQTAGWIKAGQVSFRLE